MKIIKWMVVAVSALVVLLAAAVLLLPHVVKVQKYKPQIEKIASDALGRPLVLGGEIKLSLFPWVGVSLTDVRLENPPGFREKDFLTVQSFDVRVKLLPLLTRNVQVKRLALEKPRIFLERLKNGRGNWEGFGGQKDKKAAGKREHRKSSAAGEGTSIASLAVGEISISDGLIRWEDHASAETRKVAALNVRVRDVSLDKPIHLELSAMAEGRPVSVTGDVGPFGNVPGQGTIPLDVVVEALDRLKLKIKGKVFNLASKAEFDLLLEVAPFSLRKLFASLERVFPVQTADPKVLNLLEMRARITGGAADIAVSEGVVKLDDSRLACTARVSEFSRPNIQCSLELDQLDVDRYLPPAAEKAAPPATGEKSGPVVKKTGKKPEEAGKASAAEHKFDYTPLRRLLLDSACRIGKLKVHGLQLENVVLKVTGTGGRFRLDPLTCSLYQGTLSSTGMFDCRQDVPRSGLELQTKDVAVGPLLKDFLHKDLLEGTLASQVSLSMSGDEPETIKRSLNGKGNLTFRDGAIIGIDLASMVRNVKSGLGLGEKTAAKPRTDFAELLAPFTIVNGLVKTPGTTLKSPLLRLNAAGWADLPRERLDFRLEPKIVGTIKGQGDTQKRSGLVVPLLVSGSFSSPKIQPDFKGMINDNESLKKIISGEGNTDEEIKSIKRDLKGLLKGFSSGR